MKTRWKPILKMDFCNPKATSKAVSREIGDFHKQTDSSRRITAKYGQTRRDESVK